MDDRVTSRERVRMRLLYIAPALVLLGMMVFGALGLIAAANETRVRTSMALGEPFAATIVERSGLTPWFRGDQLSVRAVDGGVGGPIYSVKTATSSLGVGDRVVVVRTELGAFAPNLAPPAASGELYIWGTIPFWVAVLWWVVSLEQVARCNPKPCWVVVENVKQSGSPRSYSVVHIETAEFSGLYRSWRFVENSGKERGLVFGPTRITRVAMVRARNGRLVWPQGFYHDSSSRFPLTLPTMNKRLD